MSVQPNGSLENYCPRGYGDGSSDYLNHISGVTKASCLWYLVSAGPGTYLRNIGTAGPGGWTGRVWFWESASFPKSPPLVQTLSSGYTECLIQDQIPDGRFVKGRRTFWTTNGTYQFPGVTP